MKIIVINGPNLARLDIRDSSIYGDLNYKELVMLIESSAKSNGFEADVRQSDDEATIIGWLHEAADTKTPVIINPAAFTHTSVAILDALNTFDHPIIEVHISNVHKREEFRHHSYVSAIASGVIAGFGTQGYQLAIQRLATLIKTAKA